MKLELTSTRIINWISLLMILVMIVLLFTPYWTYTTKEKNPETGKREEVTKTISINDYVWFPYNHKDLTKGFENMYENKDDFWINDMVLMPVLVLLAGTVFGVISLWHSAVPFSSLLALFLGSLGLYGYLGCREFGGMGGSPTIHVVFAGVTAAVGLAGVVTFIVKLVLKKIKK